MTGTNRVLPLMCAAWTVVLAASVVRAKDGDRPIVEGALGRQLDAAIRQAGGDDFWGAVLVAREGGIALANGYGFADYGKIPNSPRTLFELASVSKQVTAVAILHLEQRGKLKVTDTLDRFFPDVPPDKKAIQLHHLLSHTSGITSSVGIPYQSPISRRAGVEMLLAAPLRFEPGVRYEYSNVGYTLLAAVVEEVTKSSFEEYVEKHLFRKAKMADTGFIGDRDLKRSGRDSIRRTSEPGSWTAADWHWGWGYKGMGGVVTTVLDIERWDRALRGEGILKEEAKRRMYTPVRADYGYGWHLSVTDRGTRKAHHSGMVAGYGTNLVRYLEDDALVVVLSNHGRPAYEVARAIENVLFHPVPLELAVSRKGYKPDAGGRVSLPPGLPWDARVRGETLTIRLKDGPRVPVEIRAPTGRGRGLLASLDAILSEREFEDPGPAVLDATLCLGRYGSAGRVVLTENLELLLESADRRVPGCTKSAAELRWYLHVKDAHRMTSPLLVKLNLAGIQALADALGGALK